MPSGQQQRTARDQNRELIREFRRVVASAVGAIRSDEIRDNYSAISLEELIDQHIARLNDSTDQLTMSRRQRVQKVRDDLINNLEAIKNTPPSAFRRRDAQSDANTAPDGSDG